MKNSTPLHFPSRYGHISVVEYLVNQKADIDAKDKDDLTPLHYAAENGHLSVVEYLVNQKADINVKAKEDWTPLHYAANNGHLSVVENLFIQKADINAQASGYPSGTPLIILIPASILSLSPFSFSEYIIY